MLVPSNVYRKRESQLSITVHRQGSGSGAIEAIARAMFLVPDRLRITALTPRPDGAIVETEDSDSAEAVRAVLASQGWTANLDQVWARYHMVVPAQLAGHGEHDTGLEPVTLVRGLLLRNFHHGLPPDSMRYVSHTWEQLPARGNPGGQPESGTRQRLRIYVDVSPEGEVYLREHGYLLETLVAAIRLRAAPRNRQTHDG